MEHQECQQFAKILRSKGILFSKIANEIRTPSYGQIQKHKSEGLEKGVPDYLIVLPKKNGGRELCFVEMKKQGKGGVVSTEQKRRLFNLNQCGVKAKVCRGCAEALMFISEIMRDDKTE